MIIGLYAGTFDPLTNGHIDIIKRSLSFCDHLIVGVGVNSSKKTIFSTEERITIIQNIPCINYELSKYIKVYSFNGLLVDYAKSINANILIRGIRSVSDFEYEINLANINKVLAPEIETVFLPTSPELAVVSSSMVKEIAKYGGDISKFVTTNVASAIKQKMEASK